MLIERDKSVAIATDRNCLKEASHVSALFAEALLLSRHVMM